MQINDRVKLISTMVVLFAGMITAGCGSRQPPPAPAIPEVAIVTVQATQVVLTIELPGRTSAYLVAEIRPQVSGIIQKRLFKEGSDVRAGDVLYEIDPATYQAEYGNAMASLAKAEVNLPPLRLKAERYKGLVPLKAVSQQDYDEAVASLKQAEAAIQQAEAALETARINLSHTHIKAPITGRIGKSNVTVGALATAYQSSAFATIQQLDPIYVDATQSSVNLLQLKRNMAAGRIKGTGPNQVRVKLLLEDGTPYPLEGTLQFSDVTVNTSTGSFILRMVFPNPKHILLPGMYVRAIVQEGVIDRGILAPQEGVSRDSKGNPIALIVDGSDKVEQRVLRIDRAVGNKWLITKGLEPGDRLIVEGIQKVRPGASVKVIPLFDSSRKDGLGVENTVQAPTKKN